MAIIAELIEAPLAPDQLVRRWQALSKPHGIAPMRIGEALRAALGGHTMAEVGVATSIGVRAPDVAWCSEPYLAAHPEEMQLSSAPELCVEIVPRSNALPKLRETALAYMNAGALEAWLVYPHSRELEIYTREGAGRSRRLPWKRLRYLRKNARSR
jgi:Uma2 family endonuclease